MMDTVSNLYQALINENARLRAALTDIRASIPPKHGARYMNSYTVLPTNEIAVRDADLIQVLDHISGVVQNTLGT